VVSADRLEHDLGQPGVADVAWVEAIRADVVAMLRQLTRIQSQIEEASTGLLRYLAHAYVPVHDDLVELLKAMRCGWYLGQVRQTDNEDARVSAAQSNDQVMQI
jgi:hypothetical protein